MNKDIIDEYNKEINKFWKESDSTLNNLNSWEYLMMTYEELCKRLPFIPFTIVGNRVYKDGLIEGSFIEAMFIAIGECCKKYNNREYLIKYE